MKKLIFFFTFFLIGTFTSFGQYKFLEGTNYSHPLQIDSSNYYIIGSLIDKSTRPKYNSGQQYDYGFLNVWTNVRIYNSVTRKSTQLFSSTPISISPLMGNYIYSGYNYGGNKGSMSSGFLKKNIVWLVRTDEYNKDGIIDEDDPLYIFMCSKTGANLTQISPKELNVTSFNVSLDGKTLIVVAQKDKNGDKKFINEDELIYQIDLDDDISKIKTTQINL